MDLFCGRTAEKKKKKKNERKWRDTSRRSGRGGSSAGASRSSRPPLANYGGDPPPPGTGPGSEAAAPAPGPSTDFSGARPTLPPSTAMGRTKTSAKISRSEEDKRDNGFSLIGFRGEWSGEIGGEGRLDAVMISSMRRGLGAESTVPFFCRPATKKTVSRNREMRRLTLEPEEGEGGIRTNGN